MSRSKITKTMIAIAVSSAMLAPIFSASSANAFFGSCAGVHPCAFAPPGMFPPPPPAPPAPSGPSAGELFGAGVVGGIIGGAMINGMSRPRQPQVIYQQAPPVVYRQAPAPHVRRVGITDAHRRYCEGKYRSYNPYTDTFRTFSGYDKPCRSPYM